MRKVGLVCTIGLLAAYATTAQAAYPGRDASPVASAGMTRLALNPQPEPPNKNKKNKKPQKVKTSPGTTPQNPDRGPAPGQGY